MQLFFNLYRAITIQTAAQLQHYISQKTMTVLFIIQRHCNSCKYILDKITSTYYPRKYPDLTFVIVDYNIPELGQAIGPIVGTPATRVYYKGRKISNDLVSGLDTQFEQLIANSNYYYQFYQ